MNSSKPLLYFSINAGLSKGTFFFHFFFYKISSWSLASPDDSFFSEDSYKDVLWESFKDSFGLRSLQGIQKIWNCCVRDFKMLQQQQQFWIAKEFSKDSF